MALVIGHKGAAALGDENRIAGFTLARTAGADGVELDVRRAHGDRLAVWHDPALPDGRALLHTPWEQLDGAVDDLPAVLDATSGLELVNVEIKNRPAEPDYDTTHAIAGAVATALAARPTVDRARTVVSCFDLPTLEAARAHLDTVAPEVATGWLLWLVTDIARAVDGAAAGGHRSIHPHHSAVTPDLVAAAHAAGLRVNCWTCNDPDRIRWLAGIGTDGIITDDPRAARLALADR